MKVFEVEMSDNVERLNDVVWVAAESEAAVREALGDMQVGILGPMDVDLDNPNVDFTLPRDHEAFVGRLRAKTDLQVRASRVQERIIGLDYYVETYRRVLREQAMHEDAVYQGHYDDKRLVLLMHLFWEALPDSAAIRRAPFYELCEIAEHIFDEEGEE